MSRKVQRRLLRLVSRIPGVYAVLAFVCARRVTVKGSSMAPTLLAGDRILIDRLAYVRERPKRGDVVLLANASRPGLKMVKRVAALPAESAGGATLGPGEFWVLGDAADSSTDSRVFGPVKQGDLLGRAWIRYWPTDRWQVFD
jgi:nickel-type superoxide dismutase maturation protease